MQDSIFTKIIKGEIPCYKIYEDELTFAFLDIHPIQPGMVLVVTKTPAETFLDLKDEDAEALWKTVRKVAAKLKQAFPGKKRIGVQIEGLDVPHVHVKVFPIDTDEEFRQSTDMSADPDDVALTEMAQKLAF
jgi:histidine triad (HIT) family protein